MFTKIFPITPLDKLSASQDELWFNIRQIIVSILYMESTHNLGIVHFLQCSTNNRIEFFNLNL